MKCSHVIPFFDRMFREGDAFDRPDVVAHVHSCETCGKEYRKWCRIAQQFTTAEPCEVPQSLNRSIMLEITAQNERKRFQWFTGMVWHIPAAASFAAVALVIMATVLFNGTGIMDQRSPTVSDAMQKPESAEFVHFEIVLPYAREVALVGDFNKWDSGRTRLTRKNATTWSVDLPLVKGSYQYLFLVDGKEWKDDPGRPERIPDGFGGYNSVIEL